MDMKKIIAREGLIAVGCYIVSFAALSVIVFTSSSTYYPEAKFPNIPIYAFKGFPFIYIPILIIRLLIHFVLWAIKTLKEK